MGFNSEFKVLKTKKIQKIMQLLKWTFVQTQANIFYDKMKIERKIKLSVINNLEMFQNRQGTVTDFS